MINNILATTFIVVWCFFCIKLSKKLGKRIESMDSEKVFHFVVTFAVLGVVVCISITLFVILFGAYL